MISLTIKLTNRCNMSCKHCYDFISHTRIADMPDDVLDKTIEYTLNYARKNSNDMLLVTFIGGEVMLVGEDKILSIMDRLESQKNIRFMLSTNLMYDITPKVLEIADRSKNPYTDQKTIATSWDYKIRFDTKEKEDLFYRNITQLSQHGVVVSVSVALTHYLVDEVDPAWLFKKMHDCGISKMIFEKLLVVGNAKNNLDIIPLNREVDDWLVKAYDANSKYGISIEEFDEIEYAISNGTTIHLCQSLCNDIVVNTDGTLSFLKNSTDLTYGDVFGNFNEKVYFDNLRCDHHKCVQCMLCENYNRFCNGICKLVHFDKSGCPGYSNLIKHMRKKILSAKK